LVRRRCRARDALGHARRRLGIRHPRGGSGAAQDRRDQGRQAEKAGAPTPAAMTPAAALVSARLVWRVETGQPRSVPPLRLPISATIFAASASISSSVIVLSRGWMVTAMAMDFLSGSMPLPS